MQWSFFAEGGLGAARMSSNLLYARGLAQYRTGFTYGGGAGVDYHFLSRHFSIGAARRLLRAARRHRAAGTLSTTMYLRYTF